MARPMRFAPPVTKATCPEKARFAATPVTLTPNVPEGRYLTATGRSYSIRRQTATVRPEQRHDAASRAAGTAGQSGPGANAGLSLPDAPHFLIFVL